MKNLVTSNLSNDMVTNEEERRISPTSETGNGMRKLQDEINTLTKKNGGEWRVIIFLPQ